MKQIPLVRKNNMLQLWGRVNGSVNIQFILDTGCSSTLLSKEVGDILFLKGNLVKSDVKGTNQSKFLWRRIYSTAKRNYHQEPDARKSQAEECGCFHLRPIWRAVSAWHVCLRQAGRLFDYERQADNR